MGAEGKVRELGIKLKEIDPSAGKLAPFIRTGNLLFTSGHTSKIEGKVGENIDKETGYKAARESAIDVLSTIKTAVGSLDKVKKIVNLFGMVNCSEGFSDTPYVIYGATDLFLEIFGPEIGRHSRSAVGMSALPSNKAVEIQMVIEIQK